MLRREFVALIRETLAGAQFLRWLINKDPAQRIPPSKIRIRSWLRDAVNRIIYSKQDQRVDSAQKSNDAKPSHGDIRDICKV